MLMDGFFSSIFLRRRPVVFTFELIVKQIFKTMKISLLQKNRRTPRVILKQKISTNSISYCLRFKKLRFISRYSCRLLNNCYKYIFLNNENHLKITLQCFFTFSWRKLTKPTTQKKMRTRHEMKLINCVFSLVSEISFVSVNYSSRRMILRLDFQLQKYTNE